MSLRLRLSLVYISLLGGSFLLLGSLVYSFITVALMVQVDMNLNQAAGQLIDSLRVNTVNQLDPRSIANYLPPENLNYQIWDTAHNLQYSYPAGNSKALDESELRVKLPLFHLTTTAGEHLRVLTIPLKTSRGPAGVLQVATNMVWVDLMQQTLSSTLILLSFLVMIVSGGVTWIMTGRALAPLYSVTQVATQITRADDLQRRIPIEGSAGDEVGQLIQAFNQTLERLEQLFNTQRRLMTDVSHELRTPLTVIKGNVGLIGRMGSADKESLDSINSEVDRLTRLVDNLLLIAQAESGKLPLDMGPVELDTVLCDVFEQIERASGKRLHVRLVEIDQVKVMGDRDRLKQVLVNIIGNAVRYTPEGGDVSVYLRKVGEQAQVVVNDTGPGIPEKDLPHIFERFYRGSKSRTRTQDGGGFGLGLSIAYWIIENHGGRIEVISSEGKGSTFCVWLPLLQGSSDGI
jgi:two-component system, OmpR family, sensor kinase